MVRKKYQDTKTGFELQKFLSKIGFGKEDVFFWKNMCRGMVCTYAIFGAAWLYNETSPLGWWTLMPKPKEEKELAHLYERIDYPYPGDKEAMDEFIAKGGAIGTKIGPKGIIETEDYRTGLQNEKFEQEVQKMWFRMRNKVISELQEKGYDVEQVLLPCAFTRKLCILCELWVVS